MAKELPDDTRLYRIMPLERLLQMLDSKENTLVKPKLWDDPYEKNISNLWKDGTLYLPNNYCCGIKMPISKGWYGQCWTLNEESDALWRTYTKGMQHRSVKISTTVKQLRESYSQTNDGTTFELMPVEYLPSPADDYVAFVEKKKAQGGLSVADGCRCLTKELDMIAC
ncbi:MAG: hypothetical protein IJ144_02590 [Prevotella sp.]|nr:hypothetical protein [Prevotella sp.]